MNDQRLEVMIGRLLQTGVLLAAAVVTAGGGLLPCAALFRFRQLPAFCRRRASHPDAFRHHSIGGHLNSEGLMQLGLVLLILTPVGEWLWLWWIFSRERSLVHRGQPDRASDSGLQPDPRGIRLPQAARAALPAELSGNYVKEATLPLPVGQPATRLPSCGHFRRGTRQHAVMDGEQSQF